ncbi:saccharopine dehydrogenase NADP-binding domain-containing protein [Mameliella sp. AT18]|uniref:shikimate dehydrogenase family protein n=1 Tax=Mameliella sp. AT18 TaxID=3028385 RepID=UPI00237A8A43|nr:saccharopine dehydrogenase NADP-binding domain-containing protein [Mameliella sp. AT18]MDD9728528.1 saccharopine dehydrogenase NADP-binding domain-containing protein [Mameliella sp. AT18]
MTDSDTLLLGLIGDNIARSRAPVLHRLAGAQNGIAVQYDRLVPRDLGEDFEQVFDRCAAGGYRGINVTYPYKERVTARLRVDDPLVQAMGACNTVIFEPDGPRGFNTDFSGFIAAYERVRGKAPTGPVLMIGTGGVGRAVAFGLARLGAPELRLVDRDLAKAEALAEALREAAPEMKVVTGTDATALAAGAGGLVNCTPVGMVGYEGTPLPRAAMAGAVWAFDAVYTPVDTQFLTDAGAEGLDIISGWELFFYQGVHAWAHFAGLPLDEPALRAALQAEDAA